MGKRLFPALLAALLLSGCAPVSAGGEGLRVLCTTYPMYLLTTSLTQGVEGVEVSLLVNSQTSCLHDYTLTVKDMKAIEGADIIVMNGAGLEDFMSDALSQSDAAIIDCSEGVELLPSLEHTGHDHDHHHDHAQGDPHYWMDPGRAMEAREHLHRSLGETMDLGDYEELSLPGGGVEGLSCPYLITFHDGFQYFAQNCGLTLLKAIEEEAGSTASAAEIKEIVALINEHDIPAIFVEKNGSRATAEVIARETGCQIYELDMMMSGEGDGLQPYLDAMAANRTAVQEALK